MIMNCHAARAVLDLHAEGRLTPRRAKSVEAHLASCADCRAFAAPLTAPVKAAGADFKARLASALKAQGQAAPAPQPRLELNLWPRDFSAVAFAAAALALIAVVIGWSGAPSQRYESGDELAGRTP
jgi:anti-sigma factor RsiW